MRDSFRVEMEALNGLDMAIARFNREGVVTYLNPAGEQLLGAPASAHIDLRRLFPDEEEYARVIEQFGARLEGHSASYETTFRRVSGTPGAADIPINVYAFPETGADGEVLGSVVLIRDLREERARAAIHAAIESSSSNSKLFPEVAREVATLLPFDEFRVVMIGKSRKHIRRIYSTDIKSNEKYPHRWWPMPPFIQKSLSSMVPGVIEVDAMRRDPEYIELAKTDEAMRRWLDTGVSQVLNIPIRDDNHIVAFLSLETMTPHRYTPDMVALLTRLPVVQAVMSSLNRGVQKRQRLMLDLVGRLGVHAVDVREVAVEMVECLGKTFGWSHVSIFQRDTGSPSLRLICQANYDHPSLPEDCSVGCRVADGSMAGGTVLARAVLGQRIVNQPLSRAGSPFSDVADFNVVGSSLAIPINGRRTEWVLYVESRHLNAFADEEEDMLELLAGEAAAVLHRSALFELQAAVLGAINDAVIETDDDGSVRWSNDAAKQLLRLDPQSTERLAIGALLPDPSVAILLQGAHKIRHHETTLQPPAGDPLPVMVSVSTLPARLGGRVYVISNMTLQKELHKLDHLREVFRHAALEGRIPLALASTWLQQCASDERIEQATINKIVLQLGRADLPLERLMRLVAPDSACALGRGADLIDALSTTLDELPGSLLEGIDYDRATPSGSLFVEADFNDLQFCIESMISFGVRTRPTHKMLEVRVGREGNMATVSMLGDWIPDIGGSALSKDNERWRRKTLFDLTLGESVIERIVARTGGRFVRHFDRTLRLEIHMPRARST